MLKVMVLSLSLFVLVISCQQRETVRTLTVTIDESLNSESQWVYWISLYGNEFNIIDSCFIEKGQTEFVLKDSIMNDSVSKTEIVFSKKFLPWLSSWFDIDSGDRDIKITNLTSNGLYAEGTIINGALATIESQERFLKLQACNIKIKNLKDSLMYVDYNDTLAISQIINEIESTQKYLLHDLTLCQLDSVRSTTTIANLIRRLGDSTKKGELSKEVLDSVVQIVGQKYPDDVKIQTAIKEYITREATPPPSPRSEYWRKRVEEIWYIAYNKDLYKQKDGNIVIGREPSRPPAGYRVDADTTNLPVYKTGSKMGQLKLKDIQNNYHSIADIKTDYILIDFWAGWCIPCVQEIPNLIKVHDKYKSRLSIYAISLDNTQRDWRTSIEKSKSRQFIHVYAGTWANENVQLLTKSFGITSIPANFLLDKNRKVIAINLNSDELDAKLSQLLFK